MIETQKNETEICLLYKSGLSGITISKRMNVHPTTVYRVLKRLGIKRRSPRESHPVVVNDSFFEILDSGRKAYWIGLLAADGQVQRTRDGSSLLRLDLQEEDGYLVDQLANDLGTVKPNRTFKTTLNRKSVRRMVVYSDKLCESLERFWIVPNKTFLYKWPSEIPENLVSHFVRGYLDGDGNINVRNNGRSYIDVAVRVEGTIDFLSGLQCWLHETIGVSYTKLQDRHPDRKTNIRSLQYGGRLQSKRILDLLYKDADIYMTRKYAKYISAFSKRTD